MSTLFNLDEIFDIAIRIEENGHQFYTAALAYIENPTLTKEIAQLAAWEDGHIALMKKIKQDMSTTNNLDMGFYNPEGDAGLYIKAIADSHIFIEHSDTSKLLEKCTTPKEVLWLALQFEKDSVTYYSALKAGIKNKESAKALEEILNEELSHVAQIQKLIETL